MFFLFFSNVFKNSCNSRPRYIFGFVIKTRKHLHHDIISKIPCRVSYCEQYRYYYGSKIYSDDSFLSLLKTMQKYSPGICNMKN